MGVRQQDRVEAAEIARHRRLAPQVPDPLAQQRIGDQARVAQLEDGGRVPEPRDAVAHGAEIVAAAAAGRVTRRG